MLIVAFIAGVIVGYITFPFVADFLLGFFKKRSGQFWKEDGSWTWREPPDEPNSNE